MVKRNVVPINGDRGGALFSTDPLKDMLTDYAWELVANAEHIELSPLQLASLSLAKEVMPDAVAEMRESHAKEVAGLWRKIHELQNRLMDMESVMTTHKVVVKPYRSHVGKEVETWLWTLYEDCTTEKFDLCIAPEEA